MNAWAENDGAIAAWLALNAIPGLGGAGQRALLKRFGSAQAVFAASPIDLAGTVGQKLAETLRVTDLATTAASGLAWLAADPAHQLLTLDDPRYPSVLLQLPDPPAVLFAVGSLDCLADSAVAVVGSRNATAAGEKNAEAFAKALASRGLVVVSGLALGIDAAAHRGALAAGGRTIAVIGTGADRVYPARNAALARQIVSSGKGLVLSEFPLGARPLAHHFPRRNRIIAGLARGVLVVEAAPESGSLITARLAAEQGREVFAIPGSIHSPQSRGCHRLIQEGCKLVESADDVLSELGLGRPENTDGKSTSAGEGDTGILRLLGHDPVTIEEIAARSGLTADALLAILFELEMAGQLAALPGGRFQRLQ